MTDSSCWTEVRLHTAPLDAPTVAEALMRVGAAGAWLREDGDRTVVLGYFAPGVPTARRLAEVREALPGISATLSAESAPVPAESWETAWRRQFQPVRIGDRWQVQAPWHPPPAETDVELILIEPGMAFGTGLHATTRLCLEALSRLSLVGATVFDVGTGSGVLAIAACLAGAKRVIASDCDLQALHSAQQNLVRNGAADKVQLLLGRGFAGVTTKVEVVVANLSSSGALALADELIGGSISTERYICSGIPRERAAQVESGLTERGFALLSRTTADDWLALETMPAAPSS